MNAIKNKKPMTEIEKTVASYLEEIKVNYAVVLCGSMEGKGVEWEHDAWMVTLSRGDKLEMFEFKTGLGHRACLAGAPTSPRTVNKRSLAYEKWAKRWVRPVYPRAALVIKSLVSDAMGSDQSFSDWCSDYGYDDDRISHRGIYEACVKNTKRLRRIFSRDELETLSNMLQDC